MCPYVFSVLLSDAQKAAQDACLCLEPEGSVVCRVSGEHQFRLSAAQWWESCDVREERSVEIRQGWEAGQGPVCVSGVRAAARMPAV